MELGRHVKEIVLPKILGLDARLFLRIGDILQCLVMVLVVISRVLLGGDQGGRVTG